MITANQPTRSLELYEVIDMVDKERSRPKKVKILQQHNSVPLQDYLRCVFDDRVQFLLPDTPPPYTPNKEESAPSSWRRQNTKLQYLVKGPGNKVQQIKRESIFIQMLEAVHPKDAKLLCEMVNKRTPARGLTKKLVQEAFPDLIS